MDEPLPFHYTNDEVCRAKISITKAGPEAMADVLTRLPKRPPPKEKLMRQMGEVIRATNERMEALVSVSKPVLTSVMQIHLHELFVTLQRIGEVKGDDKFMSLVKIFACMMDKILSFTDNIAIQRRSRLQYVSVPKKPRRRRAPRDQQPSSKAPLDLLPPFYAEAFPHLKNRHQFVEDSKADNKPSNETNIQPAPSSSNSDILHEAVKSCIKHVYPEKVEGNNSSSTAMAQKHTKCHEVRGYNEEGEEDDSAPTSSKVLAQILKVLKSEPIDCEDNDFNSDIVNDMNTRKSEANNTNAKMMKQFLIESNEWTLPGYDEEEGEEEDEDCDDEPTSYEDHETNMMDENSNGSAEEAMRANHNASRSMGAVKIKHEEIDVNEIDGRRGIADTAGISSSRWKTLADTKRASPMTYNDAFTKKIKVEEPSSPDDSHTVPPISSTKVKIEVEDDMNGMPLFDNSTDKRKEEPIDDESSQ